MIDTHVHSRFSADSQETPRALIEQAIGMGITHLAITDHQENERHPSAWSVDFESYFRELETLREEYRNKIVLAIGVEIGFAPPFDAMAVDQCARYPFDTVINSVHNIDGADLYSDEAFYRGKTKRQAYDEYLDAIEASVRAPYPYTQIGHLGYIIRYARYQDRSMRYADHAEKIDRILKEAIRRDAVLELNASTLDGSCVTPVEILKRYYELGGRRVAPASDAHVKEKLARRYDENARLAREIGFCEWTFCLGGKKIGLPL